MLNLNYLKDMLLYEMKRVYRKPMNTKLVFEDSYETNTSLNKDLWKVENNIRWWSSEKQFYTDTPKTVFIKDDLLNIRCFYNKKSKRIESSYLHTQNKNNIKYGSIEIEAKLPDTNMKDIFAYIWMMPEYSGTPWPLCGEIDIMEYNTRFDNIIKTNLYKAEGDIKIKHYCDNLSSEMHKFRIDWWENAIEFFIDGKRKFTYYKSKNNWPFHKPYYLIMNLAYTNTEIDKNFDTTFYIKKVSMKQKIK